LNLDGGIKIDIANYGHRRSSLDGSTCVDFVGEHFPFFACFFTKRFRETAESNGFFRYADLSEEGKRQIQPLSPDAVVYAEGSYSWLYQATRRELGEFSVYETDHVLCRNDSTGIGQPAICYVAALEPLNKGSQPLSIYITAIIEQPPGPAGKTSSVERQRIDRIHLVIKTIKITGATEKQWHPD